jgi:hypothetical protein
MLKIGSQAEQTLRYRLHARSQHHPPRNRCQSHHVQKAVGSHTVGSKVKVNRGCVAISFMFLRK